jgi:hypothetical protein
MLEVCVAFAITLSWIASALPIIVSEPFTLKPVETILAFSTLFLIYYKLMLKIEQFY